MTKSVVRVPKPADSRLPISAQSLLAGTGSTIRNRAPAPNLSESRLAVPPSSQALASSESGGQGHTFLLELDDLSLALGGRGWKAWLWPHWGPNHNRERVLPTQFETAMKQR